MKFIALDCETGGIGLDKSLLTTYLAVCEFDGIQFKLKDELYLYTKPNDGIYQCTAEALKINKINLIKHDKKAITYSKGGALLRDFLIKNSKDGKIKLIPIGHNVKFDIIFVKTKLLKSLEQYVSYRTLDTGPIGQFLKLCGLIPDDNKGGLSELAKHVNATAQGQLHDAKTDTLLTVQVLEKFIQQIKNLDKQK